MAFTNTKEVGLENLIVKWLTGQNGYEQGTNDDYSQEFAMDTARLFRFLEATQPDKVEQLGIFTSEKKRRDFLSRLSLEISRRGVVDVLRRGVKMYPLQQRLYLYFLTPTETNEKARALYGQNIFSVTRQLRYSPDETKLALDLCIFINGLPVLTSELKNQLTKQNTDDAVKQYKTDRSPKDLLFSFKRCMAHFAVDDARIKFCTKLCGQSSWFLPFDKGYRDGAGNPPNPDGLMTDYFWKDILSKPKLSRIIEHYAQVTAETDPATKKKTEKQIFPRYHQLDAVEKLLADVKAHGLGRRYLIQHSAGSGKSNSIAWLAYQLTELLQDGRPMVDSVIVVTDRRILDRQTRDTMKQFMQLSNTTAWAKHSGELRKAIEAGKRIIVTTIEKFPYIVGEMGTAKRDRHFAVIIDEAHSGQSGRNAAKMNQVLSGLSITDDTDDEDIINALMEGRKLLPNVSYFAFTATPKNKTLETFGTPYEEDGTVKFRPFHVYTMKQAIQEGFILDVLANYTPVDSYYRLTKTVEDDPSFDKKKAQKKLRAFVESNTHTIARKAKIMVDHFHTHVIGKNKIGGKARAMVVTASRARCLEYFDAINKCLAKRKSPYKAIIAFSGTLDDPARGQLTSEMLNGFPDSEIPRVFKRDPYRLLIVADMFQTGFDEPLLHTMYVDRVLYGVKAVQTLSRLNRCHPLKYDTFVLDFANQPADIAAAFAPFYRTTLLSGETDPNKLYDLEEIMETYNVFSEEDVERLLHLYLHDAERDRLDPILDRCAAVYKDLGLEYQINFKSAAKSFVRTYGFLSLILPKGNPEWERLSIFLNLLLPKLPSPQEDDLSQGILDVIDLESYRNEVRDTIAISLPDEDAEIPPVPTSTSPHIATPEMEFLSAILNNFNDLFGNTKWSNEDNIKQQLLHIPEMVSQNEAYQNAMKNSDRENARLESDNALHSVMLQIMQDNTELYKLFEANSSFRQWLSEQVFTLTYNKEGKPFKARNDLLPAPNAPSHKEALAAEQDAPYGHHS